MYYNINMNLARFYYKLISHKTFIGITTISFFISIIGLLFSMDRKLSLLFFIPTLCFILLQFVVMTYCIIKHFSKLTQINFPVTIKSLAKTLNTNVYESYIILEMMVKFGELKKSKNKQLSNTIFNIKKDN